MSHSINGNLIVLGGSNYDSQVANLAVIEFFKKRGDYNAKYDANQRVTTYSIDGETQPFVEIMDKPRKFLLAKYSGDLAAPSLEGRLIFTCIRSGSHVGFHDVEAKEIYDATMKLGRVMRKRFGSNGNVSVVFDDERTLYLPSSLRKLIFT